MKLQAVFATLVVVASFSIAGCAAPPAAPTGIKVGMEKLEYKPKDVTVKVGESVIWENLESITHTVTFDQSGGPQSSGSMNKAAKHTVKFTSAGTFKYHCAIPGHATQTNGTWSGMVGSVTVTA
jgi:plastocyanin